MMKENPGGTRSRWWYLVLSLLSVPVALIHQHRLNAALEKTRHSWGLLPGDALILKWLGELSVWVAVSLLAAFIASWKLKWLARGAAVATAAALACIFWILYAVWCSLELWLVLQ